MNNSAFRDLVSSKNPSTGSTATSQHHESTQKPVVSLGSRARSFIPMTPRHIPGHRQNLHSEFARQVADATSTSRTDGDQGPPLKKFKANAAPKGTKLASGYIDRASLLRTGDGENAEVEDKEKRLKALEEMYKLQQIDQDTFERLRSEIGVGGDVSSTHLVRGLDWELLRRVKQGEDVTKSARQDTLEAPNEDVDVDADLDNILEKEVVPKVRHEHPSPEEGESASQTVPNRSSQPVTRDEILRRLKQSRQSSQSSLPAANMPAAPVLGDKFKKVESAPTGPKKEKFTESINGRRREVLLITNHDGTTKRKTRWLDPEIPPESLPHAPQSLANETKEKRTKPKAPNVMGMEVPVEIAAQEAARKAAELEAQEDEDDDIFQGVGDDYDPLADIQSDDSDGDEAKAQSNHTNTAQPNQSDLARKRNYFGTSTTATEDEDSIKTGAATAKDPTILAALKRAAEIRRREEDQEATGSQTAGTTDKSQAFLAKLRDQERQDAADLDMGFGGSRFDEDDDDSNAQDLVDFDHEGDEDEHHNAGAGKRGKAGRKRTKKRKGDKNSFADVMGVIAGRAKS